MAIDRGMAELGAVTQACTLLDLDATNARHAAVLVSPAGAALRLDASAAALIRLVRAGESRDAIAARFGAAVEALDAATTQLAARIRQLLDGAVGRRPPGFVAHRRLVAGARVARWVRPLTGLFAPAVAWPLVAGCVIVLVASRDAVWHAERSPFALWSGFAVGLLLMFFHELGHAAACRRYGAPVGDIGCALYLIYPAFYCDVTHTWALPRRARVVVDLGGVYVQLIATAVVVALWRVTDAPTLAAAVRLSCVALVFNLLPVVRLDGYWLLSDLLGVVDLRAQQRRVAAGLWARLRGRPHPALPWGAWTTAAIAAYAVASAAFLASILSTLLPHVAVEAVRAPSRLHALIVAVGTGEVGAALRHAGGLISSIVVAWIAVMVLRGLGRTVWAGLGRLRRASS